MHKREYTPFGPVAISDAAAWKAIKTKKTAVGSYCKKREGAASLVQQLEIALANISGNPTYFASPANSKEMWSNSSTSKETIVPEVSQLTGIHDRPKSHVPSESLIDSLTGSSGVSVDGLDSDSDKGDF